MSKKVNLSTNSNKFNLTVSAVSLSIGLVLIYCLLSFILPARHVNFVGSHKLDSLDYKTLRLIVNIPTFAVWLAAFVGYSTLKRYAELVKKTPEGPHYEQLAQGCTWLAWSLPVSSIITLIVDSIASKWHSFHPAAIIISNYTSLILPLIAFTLISLASAKLLSLSKTQIQSLSSPLLILLFVTGGAIFCFFTFSNFNSNNLASTYNPYYLPSWLILLSIIVPYLYVWFIGLLSSYEITLFSRQIAGLIYRKALRYLSIGLVTILASSIATQYLDGIEPRVGHLELNFKLLLTIIFRIIGGIGYLLLAIGARRLKRIEEV